VEAGALLKRLLLGGVLALRYFRTESGAPALSSHQFGLRRGEENLGDGVGPRRQQT